MKTQLLFVSNHGYPVYELQNDNGMRVQVTTYGARIFRMYVPQKSGDPIDVVAGYDDPDRFEEPNPYFNAIIGRVANRIGHAQFDLDGRTYHLGANDGVHSLHGGKAGFDRRVWLVQEAKQGAITLGYTSHDGEEGYPATVEVAVTYRLGEDNTLHIDYLATSDGTTPLSLTNHAYFHLGGTFDDIRDHILSINGSRVTVVDKDLIPTGEVLSVDGMPFDFRHPKPIGQDLDDPNPMMVAALGGFDFNYVLDSGATAAVAYCPQSGIKMSVYTDWPCLQFYSGNMLDGTIYGKHHYPYHGAFCLEAQGYPNAVNVPNFPSCLLHKGEIYHHQVAYCFEVE